MSSKIILKGILQKSERSNTSRRLYYINTSHMSQTDIYEFDLKVAQMRFIELKDKILKKYCKI